MSNDDRMAEQWIIRVQGKEYGPADLPTLDEWKKEGRLLASNEARRINEGDWTSAANIPGLFGAVVVPDAAPESEPTPKIARQSFGSLLGRTLTIYGRGFFSYLFLTLLIVAPSVCADVSGSLIQHAPATADLRTLVQSGFAFCMSLLVLILWPVYLAGIQILTAQLAGGDKIRFLSLLSAAMRFWMPLAAGCIIVYGVFMLLTVFGLAVAVLILVGSGSVVAILFALTLLAVQIWLFSQWFVFTLFWQQTVVFDNPFIVGALRRSNEIARSGRDLRWHQRPLWRGALIASLWIVFMIGLYWPVLAQSYQQASHLLGTNTDFQSMLDALKTQSQAQPHPALGLNLALWLVQKLFQPLVGIAFVLVYLENRPDAEA